TGNNNNNSDTAQNASYNVSVALWHNDRNQASMGNIAFADGTGTSFTNIQKVDGKDTEVVVPTSLAIVNALNGVYKLQSVTHPVNIALTADQGYISALQELEYKKNGVWTPVRVLKRELCTPNPDQAPGAQPFQYIRAFEMDLPDMSTQFIEVRVKVPYTPMDAVLNTEASDGWINAKVRIFWDTLTEIPGGGRLEFDTGEAPAVTSSAYEEGAVEFDIRDDATGIRAEAAPGVLPEGAELTVEAITAESESETAKASYAKAQTALDGVSAKFKLFDITIYDADGAETQPNGRLTLRFPIPEGFDADKTALYRINDDATATLIKGKVENGEYVAAVTHLSLYALVELAEDAVAADEAEETDGAADAASPEVTIGAENAPLSGDAEIADGGVPLGDFTPPQTGDESLTAYAAVFGLSLAAMVLSVTVKKRRKNTDA
ncbi:MAG: LPXTG cell wall anchor domain-containing protein, partial [Oscillospiraceae bacterium]|nr:LPXTG cell wall anchor domain-containing protein [Oscillospiraceae bacterium]